MNTMSTFTVGLAITIVVTVVMYRHQRRSPWLFAPTATDAQRLALVFVLLNGAFAFSAILLVAPPRMALPRAALFLLAVVSVGLVGAAGAAIRAREPRQVKLSARIWLAVVGGGLYVSILFVWGQILGRALQ